MATSPKSAHAGGTLRTSAQSFVPSRTSAPAGDPPPHYLRRVARGILIRAAVRGRISWFVALRMLALLEGGAA